MKTSTGCSQGEARVPWCRKRNIERSDGRGETLLGRRDGKGDLWWRGITAGTEMQLCVR